MLSEAVYETLDKRQLDGAFERLSSKIKDMVDKYINQFRVLHA